MPGVIQQEGTNSSSTTAAAAAAAANTTAATSTTLAPPDGMSISFDPQHYLQMIMMVLGTTTSSSSAPSTPTTSAAMASSHLSSALPPEATSPASVICLGPSAAASSLPSPSPLPLPLPSPFCPSASHHLPAIHAPHPHHVLDTHHHLKSEERGLLIIQLLMKCAGAVARCHMEYANLLLEQLSVLVAPPSPSPPLLHLHLLLRGHSLQHGHCGGDPMQRVASHFMEALASRAIKTWPGLYKALNCTNLPSQMSTHNEASHLFFNLCPYLKLAFTVVNHSILDSMETERVVHIIDLGGTSEAIQWVALLQMLTTRMGGPPHLRITIVNQSKEALDQIGQKLSEEAEALDIPFQFNPVLTHLQDLDVDMLKVKTGEAVAISCVLQLHYLLSTEAGEGPQTAELNRSPHRVMPNPNPNYGGCKDVSRVDRVLYMLRSLSPKVMVVMEQESDHNGADFMERFVSALHYYAAMFDSLEGSLTVKQSSERAMVEKYVLGREIHNIVACEGEERVERHEGMKQWKGRLERAGFMAMAFSYTAKLNAKRLLMMLLSSSPSPSAPPPPMAAVAAASSSTSSSSGGIGSTSYRIAEAGDGFFLSLCWQETPLFTLSAWRPAAPA